MYNTESTRKRDRVVPPVELLWFDRFQVDGTFRIYWQSGSVLFLHFVIFHVFKKSTEQQNDVIWIQNKMGRWRDYNKQLNFGSFRQMLWKSGLRIMCIISPVRDRDQARDGERNRKKIKITNKGQEQNRCFLLTF